MGKAVWFPLEMLESEEGGAMTVRAGRRWGAMFAGGGGSGWHWTCGLSALLVLAFAGCQQDRRPGEAVNLDVPASCGNGTVEGSEVCDGDDLAGADCSDFGYERGNLRCNDACAGYLVSECRGMPAWRSEREDRSDPCGSCDPDETCVDGTCRSRTCGRDSSPSTIDETYDIPALEVTGRLSGADGTSLPPVDRASVLFVDPESGYRIRVSTSGDDARSFETELFPGTYRVWVAIEGEAWPEVPLRRRKVTVEEDRSLTIDVPEPVTVDGTVSLEGRDESTPATFEIAPAARDLELGVKVREFGATYTRSASEWPADYEVQLYAGRPYTVRFDPEYGEIGSAYRAFEAPELVLADRFRPESNLRRDFTASLPSLPLRIRVDGDVVSADHDAQVVLYTASRVGTAPAGVKVAKLNRVSAVPDDSTSPDRRLPLPPGEYRAEVRLKAHGAREVTHSASEIVRHPAGEGLSVDFAVDERWVRVNGAVVGIPRDDEGGYLSSRLIFRRPDGELTEIVQLPAEDPAPFEVQIPEGRHDIFAGWKYRRNGRLDGRQLLRSEVEFRDDEEPYRLTLEADPPEEADPIERVELRGRVTGNGRPIGEFVDVESEGDEGSPNGALHFECLEGPCTKIDRRVGTEEKPSGVVEFRDSRYRAVLAPGRYRVDFGSPSGSRGRCHPPKRGAIAGHEYVLDPELHVRASHRQDFDAKIVRLAGRVTVDGRAPERPERTSDGDAGESSPVRLSLVEYQEDLDGGGLQVGCPPRGNSQRVSSRRRDGASAFRVFAFPEAYRMRAEVSRGGGRWVKGVRLTDGEVVVNFDFRSTQIAGRIRHPGDPSTAPESTFGVVHAATRTGEATLPPGEDGNFSGTVIGRDPTLVYNRGDGAGEDREVAEGTVVLRQGCVPLRDVE